MNKPLLDRERFFRDGMTWERYLERVPWSRATQAERYASVPETLLARFRQFHAPGWGAVILGSEKCGDCAQTVPRLVRLVAEVPGLDVRIFFRDEHPDLQDGLLTNGKRSIPKLALLDPDGAVLSTWGPRPGPIQKYVEQSVGKIERVEWFAEVRRYYRENGDVDLDREIEALFSL